MNNLYQNKYKIHSPRLFSKDYTDDGRYCITICTQHRQEYFGKVINKKMQLNQVGKIVNKIWQEIPKHFQDIRIIEYIIMPNHIHGILEIEHNYQQYLRTGVVPQINFSGRDAIYRVSGKGNKTGDAMNRVSGKGNKTGDAIYRVSQKGAKTGDAINRASTEGGVTGKNNPMGKNSLGEIVRWFKGRSCFEINKNFPHSNFAWQSGYYDIIIKNDKSLENIIFYIRNNPRLWCRDRNNFQK